MTSHLTKEDVKMLNNIWKNVECNLTLQTKTTMKTTIYLLDWNKIQNLTISNSGKDVEQLELLFMTEMQNIQPH